MSAEHLIDYDYAKIARNGYVRIALKNMIASHFLTMTKRKVILTVMTQKKSEDESLPLGWSEWLSGMTYKEAIDILDIREPSLKDIKDWQTMTHNPTYKDEVNITFYNGKFLKCKELDELDNVLKEGKKKAKEEAKEFIKDRADMIEAMGFKRPDTIGLNMNFAKYLCNLIFPKYHNQKPTSYHKRKLADFAGVKKVIINE